MLIQSVETYLAIRRAAGFDLRVPACLLRNFAAFAALHSENHVRSATVIEWAAQAPSPVQRERRLSVVALFARHARAEDKLHEVPPRRVFAGELKRRLPHIFTDKEIDLLMNAASRLGPHGSLRPDTYTTLFGLLASTGLRISEALALRFGDLTSDGLIIRKTKFRKSRLVPLHPTVSNAVEGYLRRRRRIGGASDSLFISLRGTALSYPAVDTTFLSLVRSLGLHPGPGQRGPRMHDLRHTFAVRALESCAEGRYRVAQHMLALSTYLGHAHLDDTLWYLHATPQLMKGVADACELFLNGGPA